MEMEIKMKLAKKLNRFERQKLGIAVLAGCFLASVTFVALPKPRAIPSPILSVPLPLRSASTHLKVEDALNSQQSEEDSGSENATLESKPGCNTEDPSSVFCEKDNDARMKENSSTTFDSSGREDANSTLQFDEGGGNKNPESRPLCDVSDRRVDLCEIDGDIRIHGNSSSVTLVRTGSSEANTSWRIRPYARKGDNIALSHVREVFVRSKAEGRSCTHRHSVPAIVFSVKGYAGNIFHDFTDLIIPLFLTARQFDGEVQFLVTDMNIWWIRKYQLMLQKLSRYPVIDFDKEDGVHCFTRAIVGLRCHKELSIDPLRAPNGYSMVDFTRFMRSAYSLERESPIRIGEQPGKKPRLMIIPRKRTRAILNVDEVVNMAEELGYEVVVEEPVISSNVSRFAGVVNSCDVMMGVHGAGLTNLVYLPTNATVIQIVPWGGLEWIAKLDFGDPAKDMKLNYLQYSISPEESSLIELYPRDHPVFKNPFSFHNRGWHLLRDTFMDKQNVRLDVKRFSAVLLKALYHLH